MAIKAGQILHDAAGFVVDRIQTAGVTNLNIPEEKIYELGNYQTVATVRDIPDLSFDVESLDVSTEIEAILTGQDPTATVAGDEFDFMTSVPVDVISPFKSAQGFFDIVRGIGIPYLTLESLSYRFGTRQNGSETFTLRGDSVFYIPGSPYYAEYVVAGTPAGPYLFANGPALPYNDQGTQVFALSVWVKRANGTYFRMDHGAANDYTDIAASFTLTAAGVARVVAGDTLCVVYGSAVPANYPQTVHQDVSIKPAAVRGKDIDVYVETANGTDVLARWTGVTGFEVTRRVNLDNDEEFGNRHYVSRDYDTADVTGTITVRARDVVDLFNKIQQVTNVPAGEISGTFTSQSLQLELQINDPQTGARVKTLYVPDARFQPPPVQGRVQQKLDVTFPFTSDGGSLLAYAGARP